MRKILFFIVAAVILCACNNSRSSSTNDRGGGCTRPQKDIIINIVPNESTTPFIKPTINVYLETSASMDGYVKGNATDFKQAIFNYLVDIQSQKVTDSLNLFFITNKPMALGSNIDADFYKRLNPKSFIEIAQKNGAKRSDTDIALVLEMVLKKTNKNDISIMITDGIISPGPGKNATEYLDKQEALIKKLIFELLDKNDNAAIIVYQLSSQFDGMYYNNVDKPISYKGERPFYIWIIGDTKHISSLRDKVPDNKFKGSGIQNVFTSIAGNRTVEYTLNQNIGNVIISRTNQKTDIDKLKKDRNGKVRFAVNVDFSDLQQDDVYLHNPDNYETNSKYELEEIKPYRGSKYTHTLFFTSSDGKIYKGAVSVKLKTTLPQWIEEVNDDDGVKAVHGKTYGIKYQLGGIFDAFTFTNNYYTEIKININ